jgi:hypothetical protein
LLASVSSVARADENQDEEASKFLRIVRDKNDEPQAMQTAICRFVPKGSQHQGLVVDLIGAVHVGDKTYYRKLNKRFRGYDAVLYELVAPEGTRVPKGGGQPTSAVSFLQAGMTQLLELEFQLEGIDYSQQNLVHADISPEEFSKSMKERGESVVSMFFRVLGHSMAQQAKMSKRTSDARLLSALFAKDRAFELKQILAEQFQDLEGTIKVFEGPNGSTLVTVRNQRAIDVLKREINAGRKKLAIFYGAAHMPDLSERLEEQLSLELQQQEWLEAWDLRRPANPPKRN